MSSGTKTVEGTSKDEKQSTNLVRLGETRRGNRGHKNTVTAAFSRLKLEEKTCDFIVKFCGEEVRVHRVVLAASSKYCKRIFRKDTTGKEKGFIEFDDVEPDIGKQCVDYIYTRKAKFSLKNPEKLIYAAELMELSSLSDMYLRFLRQKLGIEKCLEYVQIAETHKQRSFVRFFGKNSTLAEFEVVVNSNNFVNLTQSLLEQFLEAVSQCKVNLEILKWEAVIEWVKADESRKSTFTQLFDLINFQNVPEKFIKEQISKEQLVRESSRCFKKVFNVLSSPKPAEEPSTHIIAFHNSSRLLLLYDLETKECSRLSRIPTELYGGLDLVSRNGEIFVGDGDSLMKFFDGKWTELWQGTGYRHSSCYCRCVSSGDSIYMVTGSFVVEFDIKTEISRQIEEELGFPDGFAIAASTTHMYAIGGGSDYKSAKEFDFQSKAWEPIANTPSDRRWGGALFSQGKLIAIGGKYQHDTREFDKYFRTWVIRKIRSHNYDVDFYEPNTDTWGVYPSSTQYSNSNFKALVMKDKIYIVGGDNGGLELLDLKQ